MKILFLSFNQESRGSFLRAFALAKELSKLGHQLSLLCASAKNSYEEKETDGVKLLSFPWGKRFLHGYNISEVQARKKWLRNQKFDVIHAFDLRPSCIYPALYAQQNGGIIISDWADWFGRGGSVEERSNVFLRTIMRPIETYYEHSMRLKTNASTVICCKLYNMGLELGIEPENLLILPNGFNQTISPKVDKHEARQRLGIKSTDYLVGSLGAFFLKDFEFLQQVINLVQAEKHINFVHIGQALKTHMPKGLFFTGRLSDEELSLYLQACDLLQLPLADIPANHGRLPLKFSDYISAGRPVLSSNIGDIPVYIEKFDVGFVSKPNPFDYAKALLNAINNPDLLTRTEKKALDLSKKPLYRWQDRALDLEVFYTKMIEKTHKNT
jgi:glycosyltransferase involved in cell wall biosynthesis